jgi:3-oxosteroid 1-dehydrogenase
VAQDETYDFIIVGSGGGSVPAAMVMKKAGKRPLILEKQPMIGGTSAFSGGMLWIPNNDYLKAVGLKDSDEKARAYMDAVIGDPLPSSTPARRDAYVRGAPEMLRFMTQLGLRMRHAHLADYYDEKTGGMADGRSVVPKLFDVRALGEWEPKLGGHPITQGIPSEGSEAPKVQSGTFEGKIIMMKIGWRMFQNKYLGRKIRGFGNALTGQLFNIALKAGVPIWTETEVKDLLVEDGRVVGVIAQRDGRRIELRAELGVLVNAGGFSHNLEMRAQYQPQPTPKWSQVNPSDTGDMIKTLMAHGAAVSLMDEAFWFPCSFYPDGSFAGMHGGYDFAKPHTIVVDSRGKRFVNEAISHMEMGRQMYANNAVPAWVVFDNNRRRKYPFGTILPGLPIKKYIDAGYLKTSDTLAGLAAACGIDAQGLQETVARFNGFMRKGVDEDFHRGESAYQRGAGDPRVKPNPTFGTIEQGPFFAVAVHPADVGTCGGVVTDEHARVLREDGAPIPGLYATGNTTATVMGHAYPGGGVSVGPSMTYGYLAARHAARMNQ